MIVVRLMGGLGNQLFQLALALRLGCEGSGPIALDPCVLENPVGGGTPRRYALGTYAHGLQLARRRDCWRWGWDAPGIARLRNRLDRNRAWHLRTRIDERHPFSFDAEVLAVKQGLLVGYWQHPGYASDTVLAMMRQLIPPAAGPADPRRMVSVHVRRGDLIDNPSTAAFHGHCDEHYFKSAMQLARHRLGEDVRFVICSDDPDWCLARLASPDSRVASEPAGDASADLAIMRTCGHHILSNSTLGWWAARLAAPGGLVVAPEVWLKGNPEASAALRMPGWDVLTP